MELRHLKYFVTVAQELNFTKAAEKLYISQPPLSRQIKELEDEIGTQLFERNNKRVKLTAAGSYFLKEANSILNSVERSVRQAKKIGDNVNGEFRIAYVSSTFSSALSELVKQLTAKYPFLRISLYEIPTVKQIDAIELGKIDLGILRSPINTPQVASKVWYKDGFCLLYNKDQYSIKSEKELASLSNETFVFFNKDYAPDYYNQLLAICAHHGFVPNIVHQSNNINSIAQMVKNGMGLSIVPSSLSSNYTFEELGYLELQNTKQTTDVVFAYNQDQCSEITAEAIDFLSNHKKMD